MPLQMSKSSIMVVAMPSVSTRQNRPADGSEQTTVTVRHGHTDRLLQGDRAAPVTALEHRVNGRCEDVDPPKSPVGCPPVGPLPELILAREGDARRRRKHTAGVTHDKSPRRADMP